MTMAAMKSVFEGKPVRSPLHPLLVHVPIALFPISLLLDLGSWMMPRPELGLVRAAFVCVIAGLGTGVLAAVFGMFDYTQIRDDHPAKKTATLHLILNVVALGLFAAGAGLRYGDLDTLRTAIAPVLVSVAGLGVLAYSGYLGGKMVYSDGIGPGRHRRRGRLPENTIVVRTQGAGPVAVADDSALKEGDTLRVELDGVVMAVARTKDGVFAFQEFCTHRYAPLSEGALRGCEIVCPWHNSRFDLRNGKVTQGPATVELRTFRAESRGGKIWVESTNP